MSNTLEQGTPDTLEDNAPDARDDGPPVPTDKPGPSILDARRWKILLQAIDQQRCTPFLGAETYMGAVPSSSEIAREWAQKYQYPLKDADDLARVAQFVATEYDDVFPKMEITRRFREVDPPDFKNPNEPHRVLADLPLPVYISTHYYDFMLQALRSRHKDPKRERCRWNEPPEGEPSIFDSDFEPTVANPVVFHLHGHVAEPQSLALTEDDYLDFLLRTSRDPELIPPRIQRAFAGASLLFLGYRFTDLDLRVLLRSLVRHIKINPFKHHASVQVVAVSEAASEAQIQKAQEYLSRRYGRLEIGVYWGTCREFVVELRERWETFQSGK